VVRRGRARPAAAGFPILALAASGIGAVPSAYPAARKSARRRRTLGVPQPSWPCSPRQRNSCPRPELAGISGAASLQGWPRASSTLFCGWFLHEPARPLFPLSNWLPLFLNDLGASVSEGGEDRIVLQVVGVVGNLRARRASSTSSSRSVRWPGVFHHRRVRGRQAIAARSSAFRHFRQHGDLRRRLCIVGLPDRRQCAGRGFYLDRGPGHRGRLGARDRTGSARSVGPLVGGVCYLEMEHASVFIRLRPPRCGAARRRFSPRSDCGMGGSGKGADHPAS